MTGTSKKNILKKLSAALTALTIGNSVSGCAEKQPEIIGPQEPTKIYETYKYKEELRIRGVNYKDCEILNETTDVIYISEIVTSDYKLTPDMTLDELLQMFNMEKDFFFEINGFVVEEDFNKARNSYKNIKIYYLNIHELRQDKIVLMPYTIMPGDKLNLIAEKFGCETSYLKELNPEIIENIHEIDAGDVIMVPVPGQDEKLNELGHGRTK